MTNVEHHVPDKAFNLLIGGEAGQGLATIGRILANSLVRAGYSIVITQSYESRIRGGHNTFAIRASEGQVMAPQESVDLIIALNRETIDLHKDELSDGGAVITDESFPTDDKPCLAVPLKQLASKRFVNTAALGVAASVLGLEKDLISKTLQDTFGAKHPEALEENRKALANAFSWVAEQPAIGEGFLPVANPGARMMLNGNEAIALGAVAAGLRFYSYYPMTPSTSIAMGLIQHADEFGCVVEQAEDEIAAINMALGSSFAGGTAMVGTSGGGFALMVEKRLKKGELIRAEVIPPEFRGDPRPELLLLCWGSTKGSVLEAASRIAREGRRVATLHFSQVWPLVPEQFIAHLEAAGEVVAVEGNATGQLARLLRRETGFHVARRVLRFDGLPITPEYIVRALSREE